MSPYITVVYLYIAQLVDDRLTTCVQMNKSSLDVMTFRLDFKSL